MICSVIVIIIFGTQCYEYAIRVLRYAQPCTVVNIEKQSEHTIEVVYQLLLFQATARIFSNLLRHLMMLIHFLAYRKYEAILSMTATQPGDIFLRDVIALDLLLGSCERSRL